MGSGATGRAKSQSFSGVTVPRIQQAEQQPGQAPPRIIQCVSLDLLQELQASIDGSPVGGRACDPRLQRYGPCLRPPARIADNPEQRRPKLLGNGRTLRVRQGEQCQVRERLCRVVTLGGADHVLHDRKGSGRGQ